MSPEGYILSDHMTLASVVATILILDNTAQVKINKFKKFLENSTYFFFFCKDCIRHNILDNIQSYNNMGQCADIFCI